MGRRESDEFRRIGRRFVAWSAAAAPGLVAIALLWPTSDETAAPPRDPSRFGPERFLRLDSLPAERGAALRLHGSTNLPDGALVEVAVSAYGTEVVRLEARVREGGFPVPRPSDEALGPGSYRIVARFRLEAQQREIQAALHYQPRRLEATQWLTVSASGADPGHGRSPELRALLDTLTSLPRDPAVLAELDRRALELSERRGSNRDHPALQKLRLAIEEAGRPELRREHFERLLLEAYVLAGF